MNRIEHADRRQGVDRKEAMAARRERQRSRTVGFTPVTNQRIAFAIQRGVAMLTLAYQNAGGKMPSAAAIEEEAVRAVTRSLPAIPIGRRMRPYGSVSKYNQENTQGNR